jgi:iron complex outermembrane recepter protein
MSRSALLQRIGAALVLVACLASSTAAQTSGIEVRGRVTTIEGQAPLPNVTVTIEERRVSTVTDEQGEFAFVDQAPGIVHLRTAVDGFVPVRREVTVVAGMAPVVLELKDDIHFTEVVSVSPHPRDPFESYQPTSVLSGQELLMRMEGTLGALLQLEPGVSERSLGPGPSRPVIRGQDGDRVLILQDSQRTGDLSSQSADHGVTINPAAASQVEVVRGPATLLYGANAIGGLVNVISNQIPTQPVAGVTGTTLVDLATNAGEAGIASDITVGNREWALTAGGSGRRSGEYATPLGDVENSQTRGAFGNVGVARTTANSYLGASFRADDTRYGVPIVEEGETELNPRRQVFNTRGEIRNMDGLFNSVRGSVAFHRYRHEELEDDEPLTFFRNNLFDVDLRATHRPVGRLTGTVGVSGFSREFDVTGAENLSPAVDQTMFSLFSYQEVAWSHLTLQFGGRYDRAAYRPAEGARARDFDNFSFSLGSLFRPTDNSVFAASLARAARNPALEELYFFGDHPGNFTFEIGNQDLDSEVAYGLDLSYRVRLPRVSAEFTYFNNRVNNYIFRSPVDEDEFEDRFPDVGGGHGHGHDDDDDDHDGELPIIEFLGRNANLQGFEAHADIDLARGWHLELGLDSVRGSLRNTGEALPRIPPVRFISGLRYHRNALQAGAQLVTVAAQNRVFDIETPTAGYGLVRLFGAYSFQGGGVLNTLTVRLDNATDRLYRNHMSFIKDFVPEMGRNFRVVYSVRF